MILYIDPGTGSMLFTILLGVISVFVFFARSIVIKLKVFFSADKSKTLNKDILPYVIFSDDKRYWTTFESICDEFEKREETLYYLTASEDDPGLKKEYKYVKTEFIGSGMKPFSKLNTLKADVVLSTTPSLDVFQWKRSRDVKWYAHILHAVGDVTLYRMFGTDYYDAILLSGPAFEKQIRELESMRNLPAKEVKVVGLPYLDRLNDRLAKEGSASSSDTKTVLLAPSWGQNGILRKYGSEMIDALIATGYNIIIRPHPQSFKSEKEFMDELIAKYPDSDKLEWNSDNDNFDCLNRADILISDYSGVVFDYNFVFNKPFIFTELSFRPDEYDAYWLKEEAWLIQTYRKIGKPLGEEWKTSLKESIDSTITDVTLEEARSTAMKEGWNHIGESASRTADYMIAKRSELLEAAEAKKEGSKK